MRIDDLNQSDPDKLNQRVAALERQAGLGSSSVTEGRTEFIGDHSVLISGSGDVDGTLNIDGTLNVSGTNHTTGTTTQDGRRNVNGTSTFAGNESHDGTMTLSGDLNVQDGVKINVQGSGGMVMGTLPSGRAGIHFASGHLSSDNDQVALSNGDGFVGTGNGSSIVGLSNKALVVRADGVYLLGLTDKPASTGGSGGGGGTPV